MLRVLVLVGLGVSASLGKSLCTNDVCTSTSQCDRWSGCFAVRGSGAAVGKCLDRVKGARRAGDVCGHGGECDGCSECVGGMCQVLAVGVMESNHEEIVIGELKGELQKEDVENRKLKAELQITGGSALALRFVIALVVITFILFLLVILRLLLLRSRATTTPQVEPDFYASSSSSDSTVDEEEELLPRDLDPEDPDTCKICFDSAINCILLDCGHMCVCLGCAKRLKHCPMCRKIIRKRKKIYKA